MKILFVSTNRLKRIMPPMPLGLASVIAQIDESRHEIRVLDLMFSERPEAELRTLLAGFSPELVALSIRNIDNQSYTDTEYLLPEDRKIVEWCRESSAATIVVGGPAFTVSPAAIFQYLGVDFGVAGEGEVAFRELVDRIDRGEDPSDIAGLVWRGPDGIQVNPHEPIEDLDGLRLPRRELFDNQRYTEEGGAANILLKQGCCFACLYCDGPHVMGRQLRMKSPRKVAEELAAMQELGIGLSFFSDAIFNYPVDHAKDVCREIIRRGLEMRWIGTLHPAFADRELVELMRDAGCAVVSLACDSCSERMLKVLRKGFTKEQLRVTAEMLEEMQVSYILALLVGAPGENRETVDESIEFLSRRSPLMVDFCLGIRLMPRTSLFEIAVKEGVVSSDDPLMEPRFYVSPEIADWIEEYLEGVCAQHPNWSLAKTRN